jgi:hypothetical protein
MAWDGAEGPVPWSLDISNPWPEVAKKAFCGHFEPMIGNLQTADPLTYNRRCKEARFLVEKNEMSRIRDRDCGILYN